MRIRNDNRFLPDAFLDALPKKQLPAWALEYDLDDECDWKRDLATACRILDVSEAQASLLGSQSYGGRPHDAHRSAYTVAFLVIVRAVKDILHYPAGHQIFEDAVQWCYATDCEEEDHPFTFDGCCAILAFDTDARRRAIVNAVARLRSKRHRTRARRNRAIAPRDRTPR